jgi:hypothetical protein
MSLSNSDDTFLNGSIPAVAETSDDTFSFCKRAMDHGKEYGVEKQAKFAKYQANY